MISRSMAGGCVEMACSLQHRWQSRRRKERTWIFPAKTSSGVAPGVMNQTDLPQFLHSGCFKRSQGVRLFLHMFRGSGALRKTCGRIGGPDFGKPVTPVQQSGGINMLLKKPLMFSH